MSLRAAQNAISGNCIATFKRLIGPKPTDGECYSYGAHCGL